MNNINLMAPINKLGYGVVGLNILKSLIKNNINVTLFPIGQFEITNKEDNEIIKNAIDNQKSFDRNIPSLRIWHQSGMAESIGSGTRIGFPIFELNQFNDLEKQHLSSLDKILVTSKWAKNIIIDQIGMEQTYVTPLGVDTEIFNPNKYNKKSDKCVFTNIGKWEIRKGHDILIKAFNEAFNEEDNVELRMLCQNPFYSKEENQKWQDLYSQKNVQVFNPLSTHENVASFMSEATCGVFPSRAEGWNLELLEMMALGKPVIATDYSAHTEFCNNKNSKLITIDKTESAYDGKWFHNQGQWAELGENQIKQLVLHMQEIYKQWKDNPNIINQAGIETAKEFSWDNTVKSIINVLK